MIGATSHLVLGYYDQEAREYRNHEYEGGFEIASGSGNVSIKDGEPFVHLHVVASGPNGDANGGHVMPGMRRVPGRGLRPRAGRRAAGPRIRRGNRAVRLGRIDSPRMAIRKPPKGDEAPRRALRPRSASQALHARKSEALLAGGAEAIEKQHARGKLTARERVERLLDPGSFVETDMLARHRVHAFGIEKKRPYGDGVVTGWGTIDGRKVFVFSQDFTIFGGSLGRDVRREGLQDHGPGRGHRRAGHRDQRLRRRADPGGRGVARRLRLHLRPQRPELRASSRRSA